MATGRAHSGSFLSDLKWLQVSVPLAGKNANDGNTGQFVKRAETVNLRPIILFLLDILILYP